MVSRHSAGHSATTTTTPLSSSSSSTSTSSIKPTGWIRSTSSASRAAPGSVLSDRTNLPPSSSFKRTPLRNLPKPSVHSVGRRTPPSNANIGAKQQQLKLSSFFTPNTAPPAAAADAAAETVASKSNGGYQDSPSLARTKKRTNGQGVPAKEPVVLEDDDLEARAANLLRGRFGSVTRSLTASRGPTPRSMSMSPLPRSEPQPLRSAPRRAIPQPQPQPPPPSPLPASVQPRSAPAPVQITPPRPQRAERQQSSPTFEPTLMQQSLSDFTQPAWERARNGKMALFQRLAGVPKHVIMREEKQRMAEELERAHRRMLPRSSPVSAKKVAVRRGLASSPRKERLKNGAALDASPSKSLLGRPPQAALRSPRTNRRIYALETQLDAQPMGAGGGGRSVSLQPMRLDAGTLSNGQRRAVSEARFASAAGVNEELAEEEESETQPLPWAEDDSQPIEDVQETEETQPLPWDQDERNEVLQLQPASNMPPPRQQITEVPTSDDEEMLLLQHPILSSSPSPPPSPSASASPSRSLRSIPDDAGPASPSKKRRRVEESSNQSPNLLLPRSPLQQRQLPRVSPITLTPNANSTTPFGSSGSSRFDRVVAALKKEERRQNVGTQLSLNSFIQPSCPARVDDEGRRREGLGVDLEEELSDDNEDQGAEGGDDTIIRTDETQPLPWSSQTQPEPDPESEPDPDTEKRPTIDPIQSSPATQRTSTSTTSSSSSSEVSLPTESNLLETGDTQLRDFFDHL
ncbi:uncharacterized protein UTRI_06575_B [Ustilago trichophora]|uniref:Uncharacterized protein n=1 Tax=Ustilago trichophora TaxID=86804 RepID=A0A5C3EQZ0_9BASI|nr:uncharacterized protein UTRI_06575_B [Ustilago trichophora]